MVNLPPLIYAPNAIPTTVEMLTRFIASRIATGVSFLPDQTIQCGWMIFKIGTDDLGRKSVLAPQLGVMPMAFGPDCSNALNLTLVQRYVCDSFGLEFSDCNALHTALVIKDLARCQKVFMDRTNPEFGHVSGWFLGAGDSELDVEDPDNLELKSLWEVSCLVPASREFFWLPPGWQVLLDTPPIVMCDYDRVVPQRHSYFAKKYPA